ncbi:SDR family NAD(P)-dependent oxidoreductase [Armatimonas sp.]|uniref:SDR family NAD(P)-dependent oxidoreductase n=1 Tax=Armatimonas sp. TaxID=1872638 RepID=UPI003753CC9F
MLLTGKKALVTGAGRGVGRAIALLLAAEGASVVVAYRASKASAESLANEIGGVALQADLTDTAQAERLVAEAWEKLGGLDILVNNAAGFGPLKSLATFTWDEINTEWEAVVKPVITVTRAALPHFQAQKSGKIVNLSATLLQRPAPGQGAHAMAKAAVLAYTRSLAREIGPDGITVNAVSPGMALTEFSESLPESLKAAVAERTPLRRLATPEDVARAVLFFCSPLSDFITGANLAPDGGLAVL